MSTYAFVGNGRISQDAAFALLNDLFGIKREYPEGHEKEGYPEWPSDERPDLIYVLTEPIHNGFETAWLYTEYAELSFTAVVDRQILDDESVVEAIGFAAEAYKVDDVPHTVVSKLLDGEVGTLIVLTKDGELDVHAKDIVEACQAGGIRVLELTAALDDYKSVGLSPAVSESEPTETSEPNKDAGEKDEGQQLAPDHLRGNSTTQGKRTDTELELAKRLYPMLKRMLIADGFVMNPTIGAPRDS
jgi:hypothetical protein